MSPRITAEPSPDEDLNSLVDENIPEGVQTLVSDAGPLMGVIIGVAITALVALVITVGSSMLMKRVLRKNPEATRAINRTRLPLFFTLVMIGSRVSVRLAAEDMPGYAVGSFLLFLAIVVGVAWWAMRVVRIVEAVVLARYSGSGGIEDRRGRRLQTQVSLIRRILVAVIITLAVSAILLMIPQVRALGAGLLASAGVVSVVVGLALQSTLTNIFAGVQLAFTDSIRVGDVVVVEGIYANVEDITLSAVVLKVWDERRVIYPSSYFVATPFENWTRVGTDLLGTVEFDVDWRVPMDELRGRLKRLLESTDLWDGTDQSIQVTEAAGGMVKARAVVSARNSGELWDLRCLVREDLVNYLRAQHPYALPVQRMIFSKDPAADSESTLLQTGQFAQVPAAEEYDGAAEAAAPDSRPQPQTAEAAVVPPAQAEAPLTQAGEGSSIFTGSIAAIERNRDFGGPGEEVYRERRERHEEDGDAAEDENEGAQDESAADAAGDVFDDDGGKGEDAAASRR